MILLKKVSRGVIDLRFSCDVCLNTSPHPRIDVLRLSFFEQNPNQKRASSI